MKHKVPWNRTLLEDFIKEGLLTEDEEFIMRTRLAGWSQVKQAMERNISTATVSNIVRRLKDKYNKLNEQFPDRFPPIKQNDVEDMLDDTSKDKSVHTRFPCETCEKFIEDNPIGTYLITMNGHITVAIDGIIYDTFDCRNRIVRDVWIVNRD